jgi:hypothetical protein
LILDKILFIFRMSDCSKSDSSKMMDVLFVIDATGSMYEGIRAAHDRAASTASELQRSHPTVDFQYGAVCYRDPIQCPHDDKHELLDLTSNVDELVHFLAHISPDGGGGDGPEDWVGALTLALHSVTWRCGAKTMIWIADEGAHGQQFCGFQNHEPEAAKLVPLIEEVARRQIYFQGLDLDVVEPTFVEFKRIYEAAGGPSFTWEKFKVEYRGWGAPQPKRVDVLGRDVDAADYPKDYVSDGDYDMEDEFMDLPKRRNRAPVIDESAVVIQTVQGSDPMDVGGKISSAAAAVVGMALRM